MKRLLAVALVLLGGHALADEEAKKPPPQPTEVIFAEGLLYVPVDTPVPPLGGEWKKVRDVVHFVAIRDEIMDERETRYMMADIDTWEADLNLLRKRRVELADAPRLEDCKRLPGRDAINEFIKFNRAFKKHLEECAMWEVDRADVYSAAIRENEKLYRAWDAVRDAQCDFYYVTVRRAALLKVKQFVGDDDYATGKLPPHVPTWRFNQ